MEESHSFVPLLIVVVLAFLAPLIVGRFRKLRLPVVVAEILAGILVGDSGLGWVTDDQILEILSLLGFAYLMFLSGLEIDFDAILPRPGAPRGTWTERLRNPVSLALLSFLLTVALAFLASWAVGMGRRSW
jgi:Kef-type K+ transport system membrane component KefB